MNNDVRNYEFASLMSKDELELEILLCVRNMLAAKTLEDYKFEKNKFNALDFRLCELKNFYKNRRA